MDSKADADRQMRDVLAALMEVTHDLTSDACLPIEVDARVQVGSRDTFREIRLDQLLREAEALLK